MPLAVLSLTDPMPCRILPQDQQPRPLAPLRYPDSLYQPLPLGDGTFRRPDGDRQQQGSIPTLLVNQVFLLQIRRRSDEDWSVLSDSSAQTLDPIQ
jgi:hypothetical protein